MELMDALRCHQDFLLADDQKGMLRAYVTKYVAKFSDAAQDEWLNDNASANNMAATVLCRYKPYEPEMILQMCGARFRQWMMSTISGGKRTFIVPVPDVDEPPQEVRHYLRAGWACGLISLLDFLRKSNTKGEICNWLKKLHRDAGSLFDLNTFACNYKMQGEKVVAAETLSRFNDRYYGQWLLLHVPFVELRDFQVPEVARVPDSYKYLTMALYSSNEDARNYWNNAEAIANDMQAEAHTQHHIDTVLHMVESHRKLIADYVSGKFDAATEEQERQARVCYKPPEQNFDWNLQQQEYIHTLEHAIDRALCVQLSDDEDLAEAARAQAMAENKVVVAFGPPGTGKTAATFAMIDYCLEQGGRVLLSLPTASLASRMRERYGDRIDIDTCAAAFKFLEDEGAGSMPFLAMYTFIVVDEISQLEGWQTDYIFKLWDYAEKIPAMAMMGDRYQMAGFGDLRPWHTRLWTGNTWRKEFFEVYRCKDPEYQKILNTLRTSMPDDDMLADLTSSVCWGKEPTIPIMRKLLHAHPETTILTCSRWGAKCVNDYALLALFPRHPPRVILPGDVESNPINYVQGKLKRVGQLEPQEVPIYIGMKMYLTRNVRKDIDFVNGMRGTVTGYDAATGGVQILTLTNHRITVYPWTDTDLGNITYYPFKPGYASTILKIQGATLSHAIVFLDTANVPGAAYTAMSRVQYRKDIVLAGALTAEHFMPAR